MREKYDWILFDADETLLDFHRAETYALSRALEEAGIPARGTYAEAYREINLACWRAYERGEVTKAELRLLRFERFFRKIGHTAEKELFEASYVKHLGDAAFLVKNAIEMLEAYIRHFKLVLVTNGIVEVQRPRLRKAGLEKYFEFLAISDEIGYYKPQAGFFDYVFEQMDRPDPKRVLMVGDNLNADIKGARDYGLDTCWVNLRAQHMPDDVLPTYQVEKLSTLQRWIEE